MTFYDGSTTVTLNGSIYPIEISWAKNQLIGVSADKQIKARTRFGSVKMIKIVLHDGHLNHDNIRDFIINEVVFRKKTFTFTPDSNIDVGQGDGVATTVRFWGSNFVENMVAWHNYRYEMTLLDLLT